MAKEKLITEQEAQCLSTILSIKKKKGQNHRKCVMSNRSVSKWN